MSLTKTLDKLEWAAKKATPGPWTFWVATGELPAVYSVADPLNPVLMPNTGHDMLYVVAANPDTVLRLIGVVKEMREALEFYAQKPSADVTSEFAKSAESWGEDVAIWEPLLDLGQVARDALTTADSAFIGTGK